MARQLGRLERCLVAYNGRAPRVHLSAFIDPCSRIVGSVSIGRGSAVFYGSVLRAEEGELVVGERVAILEHCLVEAPRGSRVVIGDEALISHHAVVHGAIVGPRSLIGIGAILLDGVEVGDECIVAAGSLLPPGFRAPPRTLVMGSPARPIRRVSADEVERVKGMLREALEKAEKYRGALHVER